MEEKSILQQAIEAQEKKNKEAEEAKNRKGTVSDFPREDIEYFALEDKKAKVCRLLGRPSEIRKEPTDAKFILWSKVLSDSKKNYTYINWKYIEKDGKLVPDPEWILTKLYSKVNEGKWQKYEDGKVDEKTGKNGRFVKYNTETSVFKRIEGNTKANENYPPKFYPSVKVVMNCIDRHDDWCKTNKHSKQITSRHTSYDFTNDKGEKGQYFYTDIGVPKQCYEIIIDHFRKCSGVKSLEDIDAIIIRDGKSSSILKYQCYDKTDYPKYFSDEQAFKLSSNDLLSDEEKKYVLYDFDKLYPVASYAKLKRNLIGLFKLCDAELGTSFEKELEELCKIEAEENMKNNPNGVTKETEADEEKFASIGDEKPIEKHVEAPVQEKARRESKSETKVSTSIQQLCEQNFPAWNKLSDKDKKIMIDNIESFNGTIPVYKKEANDILCVEQECKFKDSKEPTSCPQEMENCPVCGVKF